jgi:magnesium transporter
MLAVLALKYIMSEVNELENNIPKKLKKVTLSSEAAGRKITTKIPLATKEQTISDVRTLLFEKTADFDTINYVYIVSKKGVLKGVFSIKDIFINPPETIIKDILKEKPIKAHLDDDQEKVAHIALKNNLKAIPVVDKNNHLLGVLPADQIHTILDNESKEDLLKLTGILGTEDASSTPILLSFKNRIPWIVVGLLGGSVTASTISSFQDVLSNNIVLASFIPLIAYIANAVANQSQTLLIRDLARSKDIKFINYLVKQLTTTSLIALVCWILVLLITTLIWNSTYLGFVVGLAMSCAILTATFLGILIPNILKRYGLDPAVGSGPFATVIQDFLSVTIYFSIASTLI